MTEQLELTLKRLVASNKQEKINDIWLDFASKYNWKHKSDIGCCFDYDKKMYRTFDRYVSFNYKI